MTEEEQMLKIKETVASICLARIFYGTPFYTYIWHNKVILMCRTSTQPTFSHFIQNLFFHIIRYRKPNTFPCVYIYAYINIRALILHLTWIRWEYLVKTWRNAIQRKKQQQFNPINGRSKDSDMESNDRALQLEEAQTFCKSLIWLRKMMVNCPYLFDRLK